MKILWSLVVGLALCGCGESPNINKEYSDSCKNLIAKAIASYDRYDYKAVIDMPMSYDCCDSSTAKSMLWWKALSNLELGQYSIAVQQLTELIAADSQFVDGYAKRGMCYFYMGITEAALSDYSVALRLDSTLTQERCNRASIYMERGEYQKAEQDYTIVIRLDSTAYPAYYNRGLVYLDQHRYLEARSDLLKASFLDQNESVLQSLSTAEYHLNLLGEALTHVNSAIALKSNDPELYMNRAYIQIKLNNLDAACEDVGKMKELGLTTEDPLLIQACR